jgi:hypothetical protein
MPMCSSCTTNIIKAPSVNCNDCKQFWHAKCQKLNKEDADYIKESGTIWRCDKCTAERRASLQMENKITEENTNLSEIKSIILEFKDSFQNFKDESYSNFNTLNNKINMIDQILTENNLLKSQINQLENKIEIMERRLIANDVVIDGIPENKLENCAELVQQIGKELKINIDKTLINDCHRIGPIRNGEHPRRILVTFMSQQEKVQILKARQINRNFSTKYINIQPDKPIYIRENLTSKGNKMFKEARDLRKQLNYQFVWTKNGIVFLRKNETDKIIRIDNEDVIQSLKSQNKHLNASNSN